MTIRKTRWVKDWISPGGIMRLLVISYFIALALGWVGSNGMIEFVQPLLPAHIANIIMQALILTLSALVLIGFGRRHAALVLALVVFFSSYTAFYAGGDISAFWRDLALIGALLMTAEFRTQREEHEASEAAQAVQTPRTPSRPQGDGDAVVDGKQFREDFNMVRSG